MLAACWLSSLRDWVTGGFESYGDALWRKSMLITTIGSQFWPQTAEGRILCFPLSLYGVDVFGYITASLASFFVDRDAARSGDSPSEITRCVARSPRFAGRCSASRRTGRRQPSRSSAESSPFGVYRKQSFFAEAKTAAPPAAVRQRSGKSGNISQFRELPRIDISVFGA